MHQSCSCSIILKLAFSQNAHKYSIVHRTIFHFFVLAERSNRMSTHESDRDRLHRRKQAPGELKEIFNRLVQRGETCACAGKNCFNLVRSPPEITSNLGGAQNQYCVAASNDLRDVSSIDRYFI